MPVMLNENGEEPEVAIKLFIFIVVAVGFGQVMIFKAFLQVGDCNTLV